jgi:hypothetical protein
MIQLKDEYLPVAVGQILKTVSKHSMSASSDLFTAIQPLRRRFLIDKIEHGEDIIFKLNPLYQEYLQRFSD